MFFLSYLTTGCHCWLHYGPLHSTRIPWQQDMLQARQCCRGCQCESQMLSTLRSGPFSDAEGFALPRAFPSFWLLHFMWGGDLISGFCRQISGHDPGCTKARCQGILCLGDLQDGLSETSTQSLSFTPQYGFWRWQAGTASAGLKSSLKDGIIEWLVLEGTVQGRALSELVWGEQGALNAL